MIDGKLRPTRWTAVALAFTVAVGACSSGGGDEATPLAALGADELPGEVLGLTVETEEIDDYITRVDGSYARALGLYSLREGEELQATLQITEFDPDVDLGGTDVEGTIVQQISTSSPLRLRMGGTTVFLSLGNRQSRALWFGDDRFYLLATRESYDSPRALLRALTAEVTP